MNRIVLLGGRGFFGAAVAELLRADGATPLIAARGPGADLRCDAEDPASLRAALRPGDVVVDAAGPFQSRTTALVEAALELGFDVVDLADALGYVRRVWAFHDRLAARGVRVLPACSSVSAVSAAAIAWSGVRTPVRLTGYLAPATRHSARRGTALSLISGLGRPIEVLRNGALATATGGAEERRLNLPPPVGLLHGALFESADAFTLPRVWPSLRDVSLYADSRVFGMNTFLRIAARLPLVRVLLARPGRFSIALARAFGSRAGGIAYEVEAADGSVTRIALVGREASHLVAAVPAALAARALAEGRLVGNGIIPPDRQADPGTLAAALEKAGVEAFRSHARTAADLPRWESGPLPTIARP